MCVHPGGGGRLVGPAAIRASFEAIFASSGIPVMPEQVHRLQQMGSAVHHLVERIEVLSPEGRQVGWVVATNVYVKTGRGWRIVAHHASPAEPQEPAEPLRHDAPNTLH